MLIYPQTLQSVFSSHKAAAVLEAHGRAIRLRGKVYLDNSQEVYMCLLDDSPKEAVANSHKVVFKSYYLATHICTQKLIGDPGKSVGQTQQTPSASEYARATDAPEPTWAN